MDKLLDLEEIVHMNKSRERDKLGVFEEILASCHDQIKRYNKDNKDRTCYYSIPTFIMGKPPFDQEVLVNYLVHHLRDNGLRADYIQTSNKIFISWRDEDIDLEQYKKRKQRIRGSSMRIPRESDRKHPPSLMQTSVPSSLRNGRKMGLRRSMDDDSKGGNGGNVMMEGDIPVNRDKYKQAKKLQQRRDKNFRETVQNKHIKPSSFEDFMKGMF